MSLPPMLRQEGKRLFLKKKVNSFLTEKFLILTKILESPDERRWLQ